MTNTPPGNVINVVGEVSSEGDLYAPKTLPEWKEHARTKAIIEAWTEQNADERKLRRTIATWVFLLVSCQFLTVSALVGLASFGLATLDADTIKWLFTTICSETFGLSFIVAKYLFSEKARMDIKNLIEATN